MSESGEKTFAPTPKKLRDAAQKGDVMRSKELATAAVVLVGTSWLVIGGPVLMQSISTLARTTFSFDRQSINDFAPGELMLGALWNILPLIASLAVPILMVTLLAQLGIGSGRWVPSNLAFKGSRINPLAGLKRMFGPTGWIEMGKGILKIALLGAISWAWATYWLDSLFGLGRGTIGSQLKTGWSALISLLFALSGGLVIIALIDVPIQWQRRLQRLKMSHQDMKDEQKDAEGSPEARAAQRQRQRDIARGGVAGAMREAQFVITNPVHFAVAMTYDPDKAPAPIVLARGRGEKALAMRELAAEYELPLLEYPALARAIYFTTKEKQTIREELYGAVATVLAFVMSLKRGERPIPPQVSVPIEMRFDTEGRREAST